MWKKRIIKTIFNLGRKPSKGKKNFQLIILSLILLIISPFPSILKADVRVTAQNKQETERLAQRYKQNGDSLISQNNYSQAAQAYIKALSLARHSFSLEERIQLATYISWGGKLKAALKELTLVLAEEPTNLKARLHLARVLSWMGQFKEALSEANKLLKENPQNLEALLIKADILRWQGDLEKARAIYEKILEHREDFEAYLGLIYTYLYSGHRNQAFNFFKQLKAEYPYQQREIKRLAIAMNREIENSFDFKAFYYHDADENEFYFYPVNFIFWLNNWKFNLNWQQRHSKDRTRELKSEDLSINTYTRPKDYLGLGWGMGLLKLSNGQTNNFLTWNLKADIITSTTRAGFSLSRLGFTETAQLIENKIRYVNLNLYMSQKIKERFSFLANFSRRDFSDNNYAHDFHSALIYRLHLYQPSFNLGLRTRYLNFKRQSRSGYFDPNNYLTQQIFATFYAESLKFYLYFEPYAGYQSYRRYGERISNWIGGGLLSLGWIMTKDFLLEMNVEGGNFSLATATGWRYYVIGLRVLISL